MFSYAMNKKDRRITLFLELFFLGTGIYILGVKVWDIYAGITPSNLFGLQNETVPIFDLLPQLLAGLASLVSSWALWVRASWAPGWGVFTLGLLLYGNIISLGPAIYEHPAQAIPMIIIVLVVMQSFPFLIRQTQRYP